MTLHELKIWPEFYEPIIRREKLYEIRVNDRDFKKGDELHLREWNPNTSKYSGRSCTVRVIHITYGSAEPLYRIFPSNVCVMGIELYAAVP